MEPKDYSRFYYSKTDLDSLYDDLRLSVSEWERLALDEDTQPVQSNQALLTRRL